MRRQRPCLDRSSTSLNFFIFFSNSKPMKVFLPLTRIQPPLHKCIFLLKLFRFLLLNFSYISILPHIVFFIYSLPLKLLFQLNFMLFLDFVTLLRSFYKLSYQFHPIVRLLSIDFQFSHNELLSEYVLKTV